MSSYASYKSLGKDKNAPPPESQANIPRITSADHRKHIISTVPIVIIDNYTDWCGPCKSVAPMFAQAAQQYQNTHLGQIAFAKENVEDKYHGAPTIRGVPCFHYYLKGIHQPQFTVTGGDIKQVKVNLETMLQQLQ